MIVHTTDDTPTDATPVVRHRRRPRRMPYPPMFYVVWALWIATIGSAVWAAFAIRTFNGVGLLIVILAIVTATLHAHVYAHGGRR